MKRVERAIVSVHDKTGLVALGLGLDALGIEIVSTGGTARMLREGGVHVREVAEVTGFPEMLDGRVKALHPHIHGGILARRDRPEHLAALATHGIPSLDLVVVSMYPFEATVVKSDVTLEEATEQIDIGGAAMVRSAAKNHASVGVVVDPSQYPDLLRELHASAGGLSDVTRARLAAEAFRRTANYDAAVARFLESRLIPSDPSPDVGDAKAVGALTEPFPARLRIEVDRLIPLRYGENPHQAAAFYAMENRSPGLRAMRQLAGAAVGYNNLLDVSAARGLLLEFDAPAAVFVKHTNPCGAALGTDIETALAKARACDPVSIYGGIVGVNLPIDLAAVRQLAGVFLEVLFAPRFTADALAELQRTRKKCRVLELPCDPAARTDEFEIRSVAGGLLVQTPDRQHLAACELRTVTRREPSAEEVAALSFAWRVAKHVKSNAIVLASRNQVIGVGAGQMNRVDAARFAIDRARRVGHSPAGSVCASDAFFPFRDGLDALAEAGVTAVIQSGGSVRDDEAIAAADERGIAMIFTGSRHLRH